MVWKLKRWQQFDLHEVENCTFCSLAHYHTGCPVPAGGPRHVSLAQPQTHQYKYNDKDKDNNSILADRFKSEEQDHVSLNTVFTSFNRNSNKRMKAFPSLWESKNIYRWQLLRSRQCCLSGGLARRPPWIAHIVEQVYNLPSTTYHIWYIYPYYVLLHIKPTLDCPYSRAGTKQV